VHVLPRADQQRLLLSLLPFSLRHSSPEFCEWVHTAAHETISPLDFWNGVTALVFASFSAPSPENVVACLTFKAPTPEAADAVFALLKILLPRIPGVPELGRLFQFVTHDIPFNEVVSYGASSELYRLLSFLTTLLPDAAQSLLGAVSAMQHELLSIESVTVAFGDSLVRSPRGIANLGATCYMNATIQYLFHIGHFGDGVLAATFDGNYWISHFQYAFAKLLFFPTPSIDIGPFVGRWKCWGDTPVNPH
jgi:hypothetical protein